MIVTRNSLFLLSVSAVATTWSTVLAAAKDGSSRPRGVGPEFAKFYKDTSTFTCISNPTLRIPFSAVNDDFCDCPDGSDEPGTSACAHLSPLSPLTVAERPGQNIYTNTNDSDNNGQVVATTALPGFYCKNKGHRPGYIPFQRVNDGICDYERCCDGSDEWAHVGGVKCEDRCKEIGKEWRKKEEERQKSMTNALKKKKELLVNAGRKQKEIEDRLATLETEVESGELKVKGLEKDLKEIQQQEKRKANREKSKKGMRMNALVQLAKSRVEEVRNALLRVREERDESRGRVNELEVILSKLKDEHNPNLNDEGVQRAIRSWEEYSSRQTAEGEGEVTARERDLDVISMADGENTGVNWGEWENEEEDDGLFSSILGDKVHSIREFLETKGILSPKTYDTTSEPAAVTEARNALTSAQSNLEETKNNLEQHRDDLVNRDYGAGSIFRTLKGKCISKDLGEYTYEHCFLEKTQQNSKKGGASVAMGNYVGMGSVEVDEVMTTTNEMVRVPKTTLEYAQGQTCWNGPARSTRVELECGEEEEVVKVTEDERCVYSMVVKTAAVCEGDGGEAPRKKDEL